MSMIHATALVDPSARIGNNVSIGPFAIVEADVEIDDGCHLAAQCTVKSGTRLGKNNKIHEGAVLGGIPQHLSLTEEMGQLRIGDDNTIRENSTLHLACESGKTTSVGSRNMIMVNAHIAHDCHVGDEIILANNVMLAGHVEIADRAYVSGAVGIHQFCRVGRQAMVGGNARVTRDVPPFITVDGGSSFVVGLNLIGLRRAKFPTAEIRQLKLAYRVIYRHDLSWEEKLDTLSATFTSGPASEFAPFLRHAGRGIVQPRPKRMGPDDANDPPAKSPHRTSPADKKVTKPEIKVRFTDDEAA